MNKEPDKKLIGRAAAYALASFAGLCVIVVALSALFSRGEPEAVPQGSDAPSLAAAYGGYGGASDALGDSFFEHEFVISMDVTDLQAASALVNGLSGYNAHAQVWYNDGEYSYYRAAGTGSFERRVDMADYESVKNVLRSYGRTTQENETVRRLSNEISDLQARLTVKDTEARRLTDMLRRSDSVKVMSAVEWRLSDVNRERDDLRGALDTLYDRSARATVRINLTEPASAPPPLPEESFWVRAGQAFVRSVNMSVSALEGILVALSGSIIPLLIFLLIFSPAIWMIIKQRRKWKAAQAQVSEGGVVNEEQEIN
jgi:hypothetical protein